MFERYLETLSQLWQYIQVLRTTGTVKNRQVQRFFFILYCYYVFTSNDQNIIAQKSHHYIALNAFVSTAGALVVIAV